MAITALSHQTNSTKTAGNTLTFITSGVRVVPANSLLVMAICCDNTSATAPTITSIDAVGGGTWTARAGSVSQSGASATAGSGAFVYCYTLVTTSPVPINTSIVITFSSSPAARIAGVVSFEGATSWALRDTVVSAVSTAGTPSVTTAGTPMQAGDLVIGVIGVENSSSPVADTDTLNGSWGSGGSGATTGGSAVTNVGVAIGYKEVTATGAQTYNPTGGAGDSVALIFTLATAGAPAAGGQPKVYVAGAFAKKPAKVWSGAAWNTKPVKVWTGATWKTLT